MENWKAITSEEDVLRIINASEEKTQIIFKDSTRCGISAFAKERLELGSHLLTGSADFNYLDLLRYRSVSDFIANELHERHQSPQIIVLKNKKIVYTATHHSIEPKKIKTHL